MNKNTSRDREAELFQRASKSFARRLDRTACATPPQASSTASGFTAINVYELHNVNGLLARFRVGKADRLRRLDA